MIKDPPCDAGDMGLIPGQRTEIPHAQEQLSPCAVTTSLYTTRESRHYQERRSEDSACHDWDPMQPNKYYLKTKLKINKIAPIHYLTVLEGCGLNRLKSRCRQDCVPSGDAKREPTSLPVPASKGFPCSLVHHSNFCQTSHLLGTPVSSVTYKDPSDDTGPTWRM